MCVPRQQCLVKMVAPETFRLTMASMFRVVSVVLLAACLSPLSADAASITAAEKFRRRGTDSSPGAPQEAEEEMESSRHELFNSSVKEDLIPEEFKVVLEIDPNYLPRAGLNASQRDWLRGAVANELGASQQSVQMSQVSPGAVELYVVYTLPYDGGRRETGVLVPAYMILRKLSVVALRRAVPSLPVVHITQKTDFREDVTMKTAVTEARIWTMFEKEIWQSWQLPFLIVSCLLILLLLVVGMVVLCFRQQMHKKVVEHEAKHVCLFPVVKPVLHQTGAAVQPEPTAVYLTEDSLQALKRQPIRIKAKGLLERRGSNASLTIDLNPSQESLSTSSLSRDSTNEDYLLSAGNRMSRKQLRNCVKEPKNLHKEFWEIPMNHPEKIEMAGSGTKNRYRTILPNEHSRVKLDELYGDPLTSYINANYIRGYDSEPKAYIATQGPMPHTVVDFWRLVWSEKVCIIVMITKLREKNKIKCEPYIPETCGKFGDVDISVHSMTPRDGFVVRELQLRKGNQCLQVSHYWYMAWPDHKTPRNPKQLVAMAVEVESRRCEAGQPQRRPVMVHCSAGIGRTGCFVATSIGMQQLLEENMLDVLGNVCAMRQDRGGMIQTAEQYEFVHRSLCLFEQSLPDQPGE